MKREREYLERLRELIQRARKEDPLDMWLIMALQDEIDNAQGGRQYHTTTKK